jgi:glycerol-3-phosphate dehydrogenase subunit B
MIESEPIQCDVTVIGAGISGMAATMFAVSRGLSVCQVGGVREIGFASGLLDLLGVYPMDKGKIWDDPWTGMETLIREIPQHPYARLRRDDIRTAFDELLLFLEGVGLPYSRYPDQNTRLITHMGTVKTTYCVPQTMWDGVKAFEQKQPCLIVDFSSLKGFSSGLIAHTLRNEWPGLRSVHLPFPAKEQMVEVLPEHMANALIIEQNRERLARLIRSHIQDAQVVGIPAILGLYQSTKVATDMAQRIGVPVFEISTMPPSIPGLRLKEAFERGLREKRPHYYSQTNVLDVTHEKDDHFKASIGRTHVEQTIISAGVILATGRFMGGGLRADRKQIRETLFDLPVHQPETREQWHREDFLDQRGHPINQSGLDTDDHFRPLDRDGQPAYDNLFAVGSILAHQDWKRMKCGVGLAVATAFGAVKAFLDKQSG